MRSGKGREKSGDRDRSDVKATGPVNQQVTFKAEREGARRQTRDWELGVIE